MCVGAFVLLVCLQQQKIAVQKSFRSGRDNPARKFVDFVIQTLEGAS